MSPLLQIVFAIALLAGALIGLTVVGYRLGAGAVRKDLVALRNNTPLLDTVEGGVMAVGNAFPVGLDIGRTVFLAGFNIGLGLTPPGDARESLALGKQLFDMITDNKPNVLPAPTPEAEPVKADG